MKPEDGEYTEYTIKLKFILGVMNPNPEVIRELIEQNINIMYHNIENEIKTQHIWQQNLEVEPT